MAHSELVAAVTNAGQYRSQISVTSEGHIVTISANSGGLGTIGGLTMTPDFLRKEIHEAKEMITDKENPKFGVDLAIPQIGGSARKTNHDYTVNPSYRHCNHS